MSSMKGLLTHCHSSWEAGAPWLVGGRRHRLCRGAWRGSFVNNGRLLSSFCLSLVAHGSETAAWLASTTLHPFCVRYQPCCKVISDVTWRARSGTMSLFLEFWNEHELCWTYNYSPSRIYSSECSTRRLRCIRMPCFSGPLPTPLVSCLRPVEGVNFPCPFCLKHRLWRKFPRASCLTRPSRSTSPVCFVCMTLI